MRGYFHGLKGSKGSKRMGEQEVIGRFRALPWHDSKLLGVRLEDRGAEKTSLLELEVDLRKEGGAFSRVRVRFELPRAVQIEFDLLAKRLCGHDIANGLCQRANDSRSEFARRIDTGFDLYHGESIAGLFEFSINMIHPGGWIKVLAASFAVVGPEESAECPPA